MTFDASFDQRSLAEIAQLYGLSILHEPEVQAALSQAADLLVQAAQDNTWAVFANPSGQLASTLMKIQRSQNEIEVGSDSPYAHRRNDGFVGTDSLGRSYNDPPYYYLTNALNDNNQAVLLLVEGGIEQVFQRIAQGG